LGGDEEKNNLISGVFMSKCTVTFFRGRIIKMLDDEIDPDTDVIENNQ